ncbi:hypothetical protein LLG39_16735, partial [bacterium]|nr:hypothetical protein [bacterium]
MCDQELSISVGELLGVPRVTLSGHLGNCHDQALLGILGGLQEQGAGSLVLDIAGLSLSGVEPATSLINVLRSIRPGICVHVVASGSAAVILRKAALGPCVRLYSSTDEVSEYVSPDEECLTSRWMAKGTQDN